MKDPKKDYLENKLHDGDIFIFPAGSPRYGGLRFDIGIIVSQTEKRLKTITTKLITENHRYSYGTRIGSKLLKVTDLTIISLPVVSELKQMQSTLLNTKK